MASVPVTVYVVVLVSVAVTAAPVVALSPVDGLQLYVLAPLAVSNWLPPYAIEGADGVTDTVGKLLFVSTTSSVDAVQVPLLIVQRSVALEPDGTPVTPEVAEDDDVIVAVPLTTLQVPVPVTGTLPANVNDPLLHFD